MNTISNPFEYIKLIQYQWAYKNYCMAIWSKKATPGDLKQRWILSWMLSTGGLSDHEQIIEHMQKDMFWAVCWELSKRGGHYRFDVDPEMWGYKLVNDYAREKNISRQYIYHNPQKFQWVEASKNVKFIKPL